MCFWALCNHILYLTSFQSFANEDELRFDVAKEWYSLVVWLISIDGMMTDKAIYYSASSLAYLIYLLFIYFIYTV